jgi:hypothetical protein
LIHVQLGSDIITPMHLTHYPFRIMKHLALTLCLLATCGTLSAARPNILFIYADDWGWGDLACHGHPHLKTPHLDRLAKEGTDFHQFTVCNPVCSPSRTAIVTGQYPARHGVHQHFATDAENAARGMPNWLDPRAPLLPRVLHEAGYATAHYGKWHLCGSGSKNAPQPAEYGYDDAAGWTGPGKSVFEGSSVDDKAGTAHDAVGAAFQTIAATDHAVRFIREHKDRPFYVNLWIHETHHLVAATDEDKKEYPDTAEPQRTYYSAIILGSSAAVLRSRMIPSSHRRNTSTSIRWRICRCGKTRMTSRPWVAPQASASISPSSRIVSGGSSCAPTSRAPVSWTHSSAKCWTRSTSGICGKRPSSSFSATTATTMANAAGGTKTRCLSAAPAPRCSSLLPA